ncbi:YfhO family protein [Gimesia fumaroli]|uniref:Bacterial membrane protein YfhO n=1 Tax=Gimesia fumaroli TaxID=2527976 RepID=A0A518IIV7_9PLAN|nr:YfhO family protein [Gimesia fumaroli]QDV53027.1 Bacterial membrane protein YfhO [Gimesia fumaroli]
MSKSSKKSKQKTDSSQSETSSSQSALWFTGLILIAAIGLTWIFWGGLWSGGGLIGGDLYTYFFPQKSFFADRLHAGEFPLWNSNIGHGVPLVAESQTGAFYPFNYFAYRFLPVNAAYNFVQILHYILAFVFTAMYVRRLGYSLIAGLFAGLVYTYGWFPSRICLEWAIIGGAWLPLTLWCVESFFQTRLWRYPILLCFALAMQILPGHFNLAFITQLMLLVYIPARIWFSRDDATEQLKPRRRSTVILLLLALIAAYGLSAVQLGPTWELKQLSQRAEVGERSHQPGYGHIPVWYLSQVVAPWAWYPYEVNLDAGLAPGSDATNQVEAHLYFGIAAVLLLIYGTFQKAWTGDRRLVLLAIIGFLALLYTPGWFLPLTKHLPGFSFFTGPGRYGIVTTFAIAVIAGVCLERLVQNWNKTIQLAVVSLVCLFTIADFWVVSRYVTYAAIIPNPPINQVEKSALRKIVNEYGKPVRLFAPGANLPTLIGVSSTPVYLGIGPEQYFDPKLTMPAPLPFKEPATPEQIEWLRKAGVTHILSQHKLDLNRWPVKPVWSDFDAVINPAWGRFDEPLYFYELEGSRGRIAWTHPEANQSATIKTYRANEIVIEADTPTEDTLILTDLYYPGWKVYVDGQPAEGELIEGMYRGVKVPAGKHEVIWTYQSGWFLIGGIISCVTLLIIMTTAHFRFWNPILSQMKSRTMEVKPD